MRRNLPYQCQDKRGISIHAPTWGATFLTRAVLTSLTNFNPRTHVGCDLRQRNWERDYFTFQSTHPRGVRPISLPKCFPPKIFQSTHPRGVRHFLTLSFFYFLLFQSTHPRGVRPKLLHKLYSLLNFNPRTHVGCDNKITDAHAQLLEFQSTHPRGVRLEALWISANRNLISIHAVIGNFEFPNFRKVNSPI